MSITVTTDVFCDMCGSEWTHGCCGNKPQRKQARQAAKKRGWKYQHSPISGKMVDMCPTCVQYYRGTEWKEAHGD